MLNCTYITNWGKVIKKCVILRLFITFVLKFYFNDFDIA